jgi:hypothetical protein
MQRGVRALGLRPRRRRRHPCRSLAQRDFVTPPNRESDSRWASTRCTFAVSPLRNGQTAVHAPLDPTHEAPDEHPRDRRTPLDGTLLVVHGDTVPPQMGGQGRTGVVEDQIVARLGLTSGRVRQKNKSSSFRFAGEHGAGRGGVHTVRGRVRGTRGDSEVGACPRGVLDVHPLCLVAMGGAARSRRPRPQGRR